MESTVLETIEQQRSKWLADLEADLKATRAEIEVLRCLLEALQNAREALELLFELRDTEGEKSDDESA